VRACVRACMHVCARARVCVRACVCVSGGGAVVVTQDYFTRLCINFCEVPV